MQFPSLVCRAQERYQIYTTMGDPAFNETLLERLNYQMSEEDNA